MPKIQGEHNDTYVVDKAGKRYDFTETFGSVGDGFYPIHVVAKNTTIALKGVVEARNSSDAIFVQAKNTDIIVGDMAMILGQGVGIYSTADATTVTNRGFISTSAGNADVWLNGANSELRNFGTLTQGVDIRGTNALVVNEAGGILSSGTNTVSFVLDAGETGKLVNRGIIEGSRAFYGGDGKDAVINKGRMDGLVTLGAGDDRLDTRDGIIRGEIQGEAGHDTLITDKASHVLIEVAGGGIDTVRSSVTYELSANVEKLVLIGKKNINALGNDGSNDLAGNAGNNVLRGRGSFDDIDGGRGNDRLFGGDGSDTFAFRTGYGKDVIEDFSQAEDDVIALHDWKAIKNFNDLMNNHARNHGDDVWITAGSDRLIIRDIHKNQLEASDFYIS